MVPVIKDLTNHMYVYLLIRMKSVFNEECIYDEVSAFELTMTVYLPKVQTSFPARSAGEPSNGIP